VGLRRRNDRLRLFDHVDFKGRGRAGSSDLPQYRCGIVPKIKDWPTISPILGHYFGEIRPASTAIIAGLVDPRMRIEIEVTARRRSGKRK
jgi:hypothetical protein